MKLRHGLIYWLDDCPPLDDDKSKRRPVIIVDPLRVGGGSIAIVVATSATWGRQFFDAVLLPNRADQPQSKTGLPRRCHAIPKWFLPIETSQLLKSQLAGHLGGGALQQVLRAYLLRSNGLVVQRTHAELLVTACTQSKSVISRSAARAILETLNSHQIEAIDFNFAEIESIGQAFADEIFRVFANEHPERKLIAINANEQVAWMIRRAQSKNDENQR